MRSYLRSFIMITDIVVLTENSTICNVTEPMHKGSVTLLKSNEIVSLSMCVCRMPYKDKAEQRLADARF
jgi:hypothetical protein